MYEHCGSCVFAKKVDGRKPAPGQVQHGWSGERIAWQQRHNLFCISSDLNWALLLTESWPVGMVVLQKKTATSCLRNHFAGKETVE